MPGLRSSICLSDVGGLTSRAVLRDWRGVPNMTANNDVVPGLPGGAPLPDDGAPTLSEAAIAELATLEISGGNLFKAEKTSRVKRGRLYREMHQYCCANGKAAIEGYGLAQGFKPLSSALDYHLVVQVLLNKNLAPMAAADKAEWQTALRPFALALEGLDATADEHARLDADEFDKWYARVGYSRGLAALVPKKAASKSMAETLSNEAQIDAAFANALKTYTVQDDLGQAPGSTILCAARIEGGRTVMVPLIVPNSELANAVTYAAADMSHAKPELAFFHEVFSVSERIIPDVMSDQPVAAVQNDEDDAVALKLPANALFLMDDGDFSIASARRRDTMVLQVKPLAEARGNLPIASGTFLNNTTRRRMSQRLTAPATCIGFDRDGLDVATRNGKTTITLTHTDRALSGNLIFPPRTEMQSLWTFRVSSDFSPVGSAMLTEKQVAAFRDGFLAAAAKAKKDEVAITIDVSAAGISFKHGTGKAEVVSAATDGNCKVRVLRSDFLAAMPVLLSLDAVGAVKFDLDPNGLLMVEVTSKVATYHAFIQTLQDGREGLVRERALLTKVVTDRTAKTPEPVLAAA